MRHPPALAALEALSGEGLQPLVGANGPDFTSAMFAISTWGSSTSVRERLLSEAEFPLPGDLTAFLVVNQLVYRGAASPTALADAIDTGRSNISKVVARLESHGLVVRVADPTDKRAIVVALTAEGRVVAGRIVEATLSQQAPSLSDWSPEDGRELERLIVKLARGLEALPQNPLSTIAGVRFESAASAEP